MSKTMVLTLIGAAVAAGLTLAARAGQEHGQEMHMQHEASGSASPDTRAAVHFPETMRLRTLANMRDHLLALSEIQAALAGEEFDKAAEIAEQRLGMTSLKLHGAHEVAGYMPEGMQAIGTRMHEAASRFAITASDAAVSGDINPALAALSRVTESCVACHSRYRLQRNAGD